MDKHINPKIILILAIGMIVLAGILLFSATANQLLFSILPNSEGWLRVGIYIKDFLILVGMLSLVVYVKKKKLKKNNVIN